jgi:hypothetical protein
MLLTDDEISEIAISNPPDAHKYGRAIVALQGEVDFRDEGLKAAQNLIDALQADYNAKCSELELVHESRDALAAKLETLTETERQMRRALRFYANKWHFIKHDATAWDTVSGEPVNFEEDEHGTACVEDGSIAAIVLRGLEVSWEDEEPPAMPDEAAHGIQDKGGQHEDA